ncbi:quinone-dependent dihydroorotate dehydrogenase [Nocardioides sp. CPCC 205120]|uniref:quinone-dependent dihydroorotate dehydrogenase n=1 Tax=Nocardioides sp. CPCC 205120 TaxID=3406462 RepID=UPI003B502464
MGTYDRFFRHVLTRTDPEAAHHASFRAIRAAAPGLRAARVAPAATAPVHVMGLRFPHRFGLAAGFDKNAVGIDALAALGFGHVEIGTVTALAQPGNPRPRLFRLPADRAVVNRMGFNNDGAVAVAQRLALRADRIERSGRRPEVVLGVNIGKSKVVPEDDETAVLRDYTTSTRLLAPYADYLVVNVSSPNTPGLRSLQAVERLAPLLAAVRENADAVRAERRVPLLVKIAPDLADADVLAVADLAMDQRLDGVIATNTTVRRDGLRTPAAEVEAIGAGGLSGAPVAARSREVLALLRERLDGPALVSVGGVDGPAEALARVRAGADLVQAYSAFVYEGPFFARRVAQELTTHDGSTR